MSQKEAETPKGKSTINWSTRRSLLGRSRIGSATKSINLPDNAAVRFAEANTNRKRRSPAWRYFEAGIEMARCTIPECGETVGTKEGSTKYLLPHLKNFHPEFYEEPVAKKARSTGVPALTTSRKDFGLKFKCDNLLLDAMLLGNVPFNFINRPIVRELFSTLSKGAYNMPDRGRLSGELLELRYEQSMAEMRSELATGGYFAVSTDGWSSKTNIASLYSIVVYGMNSRFDRFQRTIALDDVSNMKHSGWNLKEILKQTLDKFGVEAKRIVAVCTDGAKNEQSMASLYLKEEANEIFSMYFWSLYSPSMDHQRSYLIFNSNRSNGYPMIKN